MVNTFTCHRCGLTKTYESDMTTGYGIDNEGNKFCYPCIGIMDGNALEKLQPKEKYTMYLDVRKKQVTNWPSSLVIKLDNGYIRTGNHNIAGKRYDSWFHFRGNYYHAVQYGDRTEIAHVRKLKN